MRDGLLAGRCKYEATITCTCTCMCTLHTHWTCICIHVHTCHMYIHMYMYTYVYSHVHVHVCSFQYCLLHTCRSTCIHVNVCGHEMQIYSTLTCSYNDVYMTNYLHEMLRKTIGKATQHLPCLYCIVSLVV